MVEILLVGQYMFLKDNKDRFSLPAPSSEISNQFLEQLIHLKDLFRAFY
jgi:hypothetical protein